jgi:iron(III) transport system substrate-binding protein
MILLAEKGMLGTVAPETLKQIPEQYNDGEGRWVGASARARVVVYNPDKITETELPKSIFDLADPSWKGKVGFVPTSGGFREQIAAIIALAGQDRAKEWLTALKRNGKVYRRNGDVLDAVDRGQIATGLINHYYWFRRAAERGEANMRSRLYYFPQGDPGALVVVAPAAALASSRQSDAAQKFLAYLVSPEGQQTLVDSNDFEYPLATGAVAAPQLKPFGDLQNPNLTAADLGDGRLAIQLLQQVGLL